jgi:anti-anti-sigma factor
MAVAPDALVAGDDSVIVVVEGELDTATGPVLAERVRRAADGRGRGVLDLRGVSFVDAAGGRALADACAELAQRDVEASVLPSSAMERLLALLAELGRGLQVPPRPAVIDVDCDVVAVTLTAVPASGLRPVEARVLRLLDAGLTPTEVAFRFQRSVRWVEQVASVARSRAERCPR